MLKNIKHLKVIFIVLPLIIKWCFLLCSTQSCSICIKNQVITLFIPLITNLRIRHRGKYFDESWNRLRYLILIRIKRKNVCGKRFFNSEKLTLESLKNSIAAPKYLFHETQEIIKWCKVEMVNYFISVGILIYMMMYTKDLNKRFRANSVFNPDCNMLYG